MWECVKYNISTRSCLTPVTSQNKLQEISEDVCNDMKLQPIMFKQVDSIRNAVFSEANPDLNQSHTSLLIDAKTLSNKFTALLCRENTPRLVRK